MHFSLKMLNLWIGLCRGTHGLPTALRALGYDVRSIEREFANQDGDRVRPEAIVASPDARHTILLEFKSGPNTEANQLKRYSRVTRRDLLERCYVTPPATESHDVILIGQAEHSQRLQIGLRDDLAFPLLVWGSNRLVLAANSLSTKSLTDVFGPGLEINADFIPSGFVPIDGESDLWEVAEVIIPAIFPYFEAHARRVEVRQIAADVCRSTWAEISKEGRDPICARINDVLRRAAAQHFQSYLTYHGAGEGAIEIIRNPADMGPGDRSKEFRTLQKLQRDFIADLRGDGPQLRLALQ